MNKKYYLFSILITISLSLMSCTASYAPSKEEQVLFQKYYDKANELFKSNNLDGTPEMVFERSAQGYEFYYLTIHSNEFSKLPQDKIAEILWTLYYLDTGGEDSYWITPKVISNGNEYSYDDGMLHKNGKNWYKSSSSSSKDDFEMSWDIYSTEYNSLGGILTIRKQGSKYTQTLLMSDGSGETGSLSVKVINGEERLHDDRFDDYYGDYMVIGKDGYLNFYDEKGFIYSVPPLK